MALHQQDHPPPGLVVKFQRPEHLVRQFGADGRVAVEVVDTLFVGGLAGGLADVVEQHGQPQGHIGGGRLHSVNGVLPAAPAVPGVVLLQRRQRFQFRPEPAEHVRVLPQNVPGVRPHQQLAQLHIDPLRRHPIQHGPVLVDGPGGALLNSIAECGPEPQGPHHPQAVLLEALIRLTHTADQPAFDVLRTAEGIAQVPVQVHSDGVHGEVPAG